jgi:hypothetical protein
MKIVDPSVADPEDDGGFVMRPPPYETHRKPNAILSLFSGRARKDIASRAAPVRGTGAAQAAEALEEAQADTHSDLDIPSFLRRLAN